MNAHELEQQLKWRYATKQFDSDQKISPEDWRVLEQSFLLAPSSYGLQPWKFIVVENQKLRESLKAVSWNQSQVTDCSHYVVLCAHQKIHGSYIASHIDQVAKIREISRDKLSKYEEMMAGDLLKGNRAQSLDSWARNQVYIAMGFTLQAAAVLKIDACPMEGLEGHAYDQLLGLIDSGYKTIASIAFGYRAKGDVYQNLKKVRFEIENVITYKK
jgi:nitroreductase